MGGNVKLGINFAWPYPELPVKQVLLKWTALYQVWFMYMRYTQGKNEEYLLAIQEYVLNQVLTNYKQVPMYKLI